MKSPLKFFLLLLANLQFGLVKESNAILPQFDSIGHHANRVLINKLLSSNFDPV